MAKAKFTYECWRCKKKIEDENCFKYGVSVVKYGYSMMTKPLCQECAEALDKFLDEGTTESVGKS